MTYQYDLLVIGSGSSGFSAASAAKGTGRKIGIVEEEGKWGGECPNWACVPTKSLLKSAKIYRDLKHTAAHGVNIKDASIDFSAVMMRR
ncbi:MAG TPA: FAD-dependent oxidoreductase, partial [Patescibacteria group bacterium]|nr:FAD-dependent oxidoreductase [Patescibacteria group bacterium]